MVGGCGVLRPTSKSISQEINKSRNVPVSFHLLHHLRSRGLFPRQPRRRLGVTRSPGPSSSPGPARFPSRSVGSHLADAAGNLVGRQHTSFGGQVMPEKLTGTITVDADCAATMTMEIRTVSGDLLRTAVWAVVFDDNEREARATPHLAGIGKRHTHPRGRDRDRAEDVRQSGWEVTRGAAVGSGQPIRMVRPAAAAGVKAPARPAGPRTPRSLPPSASGP